MSLITAINANRTLRDLANVKFSCIEALCSRHELWRHIRDYWVHDRLASRELNKCISFGREGTTLISLVPKNKQRERITRKEMKSPESREPKSFKCQIVMGFPTAVTSPARTSYSGFLSVRLSLNKTETFLRLKEIRLSILEVLKW